MNTLQAIKGETVEIREPVCQYQELHPIRIDDFLKRNIPPREMVLSPVLPTQGLAMLYAPRGVGKTYFAQSIAYAVASGGGFLAWQAPKPRRVFYLDGEMPAYTMKERFAQIVQGAPYEPDDPDFLKLITPDFEPDGIPDIASEAGQEAIQKHLGDAGLLVLDNLSTLCRRGRENEAESWEPVQQWLLQLRKQGTSVLMVHHAGKGGQQRGTSKREDVLDTVINLKRPHDYNPEDGAKFEVHLDKARGVVGDQAKPFEVALEVRDDVATWTWRDLSDRRVAEVKQLSSEGHSVREIADILDISKSTVNRMQKAALSVVS
jgi:putative DNA primase/helicase